MSSVPSFARRWRHAASAQLKAAHKRAYERAQATQLTKLSDELERLGALRRRLVPLRREVLAQPLVECAGELELEEEHRSALALRAEQRLRPQRARDVVRAGAQLKEDQRVDCGEAGRQVAAVDASSTHTHGRSIALAASKCRAASAAASAQLLPPSRTSLPS
eukprot:CAMPEP_0179889166 /NCGR_PEP_ID=MMETSP0982-20121206/32381_1 /TAXON_ID=483367 /ORGANISM="non described non described, Strain CCMP 2436" /LENGTH=162 /DNA_ID=CAMNT_0021785219 /DNA_START=82 /DNA_END=568 /DNA_ORIENTATION=+